MVTYDSSLIYIQSASSLLDEYNRITAIIAALDNQQLALALQESPVNEYMLNDGQTVIKATYRSELQIQQTIKVLQRRQNDCLNKLNGRVVRMVDGKNFTGFNNC